MKSELLTTAEAAALAGVGVSSVKRWADDGRLACVRTVGRHRRFRRAEVERLLGEASGGAGTAAPADPVAAWVELLTASRGADPVGRLLDERRARASWYAVAELVGSVLVALGERWAKGRLTVIAEHVASERLARALAQVAQSLPSSSAGAPACLLLSADGDDHTLGLSLVELCLREAGWDVLWAGRATPTAEVVALIGSGAVDMVALSASLAADRRKIKRQVTAVAEVCRAQGIDLVLGGRGPWPAKVPAAHRFTDLAGFHRFVSRRVDT